LAHLIRPSNIHFGAGFMIVVFSLLFAAFLFGIWMGLCFYRRVMVKINSGVGRRYSKSRTGVY
jgi:hypothetical protein